MPQYLLLNEYLTTLLTQYLKSQTFLYSYIIIQGFNFVCKVSDVIQGRWVVLKEKLAVEFLFSVECIEVELSSNSKKSRE